LALAAALLVLVACQSDRAGDGSRSGLPPFSAEHGGVLAAAGAGHPLTVTDAENGSTVRLAPGDHLAIVLGSTYWRFTGSSDASVVAPDGDPQFRSVRSDCVPGGGCGAVTQSFVAVGPGQAQISAGRTVCGEALACAPDRQRFTVTVVVGN
jgi:hypothetical protein